MAVRLTLVCHAATAISRTGGFALPSEPLDAAGIRTATAFRLPGPAAHRVEAASGEATCATARHAGLSAAIVPALSDADWGEWAGRSFEDVQAAAPEQLALWLSDPARGTPGGEPFADVVRRVTPWLERCRDAPGRTVAITYATTARAVLCAAIGMAPDVAMKIDLPPLALVELSYQRGWRLQALTSVPKS